VPESASLEVFSSSSKRARSTSGRLLLLGEKPFNVVQPGPYAAVRGRCQAVTTATGVGAPSDRLSRTFHADPTTQNTDPMPGHSMTRGRTSSSAWPRQVTST